MLAMLAQGSRSLSPRQRLERLLPMAGFQVSIYGRFWVSTEAHSEQSKRAALHAEDGSSSTRSLPRLRAAKCLNSLNCFRRIVIALMDVAGHCVGHKLRYVSALEHRRLGDSPSQVRRAVLRLSMRMPIDLLCLPQTAWPDPGTNCRQPF